MAREPSAHYKAIAAEVELFRKRESSNMRRIKALEDKLDIVMGILKESGVEVKATPAITPSKPGKNDYAELSEVVKSKRPDLESLWDAYLEYGFGSYKTILAACINAGIAEEISETINGNVLTGKFANGEKLQALLKELVSTAKVKLEYGEDGTLESSCLVSKMAASRKSMVGSFMVPGKVPSDWLLSIAENEALRECKMRSLYSTFIEQYAATYGKAIGMGRGECWKLIDDLIKSGKIIRDGNTIKAA